jgi:CspA family cold shock protein
LANLGFRGVRDFGPPLFPDFRATSRPRDAARQRTRSGITDMNNGTVKFYNDHKGFGFIATVEGSRDVYVHSTALERAGITNLAEGQKVEFDLEQDQKGRSQAANLRLL